MPRSSSPAQSAAARANALRSTGPMTPEGKARSSMNARTYGLRSAKLSLLPGEDQEAFAVLEASVHAHFMPATHLEAALCARMVTALLRTERAEALEQKFWVGLPQGVKAGHPLTNLHILNAYQQDRPQALPTLLRYLGEADRAFGRALRHLNQLRSGHGLVPADAPIGTNEPEPVPAEPMAQEPLPPEPAAASTNEPEQGAAVPSSTNEPERRMDVAEDEANQAQAHPSEIEPGPPARADHLASRPTVDPAGVAASPGTNEPGQGAAAPSSTNEPESDPADKAAGDALADGDPIRRTRALRALDELATMRRLIAARFPIGDQAAVEALILTKGIDGAGRPGWVADLPPGTPLAA